MKKHYLSFLIIFCSLGAFGQFNPNDVNIEARMERVGLNFVLQDFDPNAGGIEPLWLQLHPPSAISMNIVTPNGVAIPDYATLTIERDINCRVKSIIGSSPFEPDKVSKATYDYDDVNRKVSITWYSSTYGSGSNWEHIQVIYTYNPLEEVIKYEFYLSDLTSWILLNVINFLDFDSCKYYKYENANGKEYTREYLPGTCFIKSNTIKNLMNNSITEVDTFVYKANNLLDYSIFNFTNGNCFKVNYAYDGLNRFKNVSSGTCGADSVVQFSYEWTDKNFLDKIIFVPGADSFTIASFSYGACAGVKVKEVNAEVLKINSPVYSGEQLIVKGLTQEDTYNFTVYDLQGRIFITGDFNSLDGIVKLPDNFSSGLYILSISNNEQI